MLNWVMATSRPRNLGGDISAMYIGATTDEGPDSEPAQPAEGQE